MASSGCTEGARDRGVQPAQPQFLLTEDFQPYRQKVALVVGIDRYGADIPELRYAVKDARAIRDLLKRDLGFDDVQVLADREASQKTILRSLSLMAQKMSSEDQFLFFFAGHGVAFGEGDKGAGYLVPQDAAGMDRTSLEVTGIPMDDIARRLDRLPAKHVLMIVDSCFSGFAAVGLRGLSTGTTQYLRSVTNYPARQILTAGNRDEQAEESEAWGHSAFVYELLRGFNTRAADGNGDGLIIGSELHGFLSPAVSQLTGAKQHPQFFRLGSDEGEFAFILPPPSNATGIPTSIPTQDLDQIPKATDSHRPEERLVTSVKRDASGNLTAFCDAGAPWSPRSEEDVVDDIERGGMRYYVDWGKGKRTLIDVVTNSKGQYLRTPPDNTELNNLSSLPDCAVPPER